MRPRATAGGLLFACVVAVALTAVAPAAVRAQVPLPASPTWLSAETDLRGTGLAVDDITGNGWLDIAVTNGNDMLAAVNLAYFNAGGVIATTAGWVSQDVRYSAHCVLADLDGDGLPELIVPNFIGPDWTPAQVQVYANLGGFLSAWPTWETPADLHSFRVAVGDPDGDGRLDLAVATGEAYRHVYTPNLIYFNVDGQLATEPGWISDIADACKDIRFVDITGNGWQDLVTLGGGAAGRVHIYHNEDGVLSTTPDWSSDFLGNGNTFDLADLDGDGRLDLLVGYNGQFAGFGGFAVYLTAGGELPRTPTWLSSYNGLGSAVICADIDGHDGPDLITGGWWQPVRIYLNDGSGGFSATPDWQTAQAWSSVIEAFALADLDASHARTETVTFPAGSRLLQLPDRHLQSVDAVTIGGRDLPRTGWSSDRRDGWVSLAAPAATTVTVSYRVSSALDLVVSNWDTSTYVFGNPLPTAAPASPSPAAALTLAPNPFNPRTTFTVDLAGAAAAVRLEILDLRGRRLAILHDAPLGAGRHHFSWQPAGLPGGVYLYRLHRPDSGGDPVIGKAVLVR
jgi:hypothetical protein